MIKSPVSVDCVQKLFQINYVVKIWNAKTGFEKRMFVVYPFLHPNNN